MLEKKECTRLPGNFRVRKNLLNATILLPKIYLKHMCRKSVLKIDNNSKALV